MMGLFNNPKCPHCGSKLEPTYYAFPFPQWRCNYCIKQNEEREKDREEMEELKERIRRLENKK